MLRLFRCETEVYRTRFSSLTFPPPSNGVIRTLFRRRFYPSFFHAIWPLLPFTPGHQFSTLSHHVCVQHIRRLYRCLFPVVRLRVRIVGCRQWFISERTPRRQKSDRRQTDPEISILVCIRPKILLKC